MAFISHMGTSTMVGHYVCHILKDGRWVIYNDNKVAISECPPKDLGYLYLYRRVPPSWLGPSPLKRSRTDDTAWSNEELNQSPFLSCTDSRRNVFLLLVLFTASRFSLLGGQDVRRAASCKWGVVRRICEFAKDVNEQLGKRIALVSYPSSLHPFCGRWVRFSVSGCSSLAQERFLVVYFLVRASSDDVWAYLEVIEAMVTRKDGGRNIKLFVFFCALAYIAFYCFWLFLLVFYLSLMHLT